MSHSHIAIIGAGLTGITAAIRATEQGHHVDLYEAAPQLGGRTRSFFHQPSQTWVDHGPHLLIGVYERTLQLLKEANALQHTAWQDTLALPLWDTERGHFGLKTSPYLPFSLALIRAVQQMSGHGLAMIPSLLRMAFSMNKMSMEKMAMKKTDSKKFAHVSVTQWMQQANIQLPLQRDMIEVLCFGAMNEAMDTADAASFAHVLQQAFANHKNARLGWFTKPLSQALIDPLVQCCEALGVRIHTSSRVQSLQNNHQNCTLTTRHGCKTYDKIVLATAPTIRNKLLNIQQTIETRSITNIHLWFDQAVTLASPFIGGIGTYGQWFFDVSHQFHQHQSDKQTLSHICIVISADQGTQNPSEKIRTVINELQGMTGQTDLNPVHQKVITVQAATHLVRPLSAPSLPHSIIDACEQPMPGELPATIESAIIRGEQAISKI